MTPQEITAQMMKEDHFSRWMGLTVEEIGEKRSVVSMIVKKEMLNGFGILHGGVAYAMADSAFAFLCNGGGRVTVSIQGSMTYHHSAKEGDHLTAEALPIHVGGRISHYEVTVKHNEEIYYRFTGVAYHTAREYPL